MDHCQTNQNFSEVEKLVISQHTLSRMREVFLICMVGASILSLVSLIELSPNTYHGWGFFLYMSFGKGCYLVPVLMGYFGITCYLHWYREYSKGLAISSKIIGASIIFIAVILMIQLALGQGGEIGYSLLHGLLGICLSLEAWIVSLGLLLIGLFLMTRLSFYSIFVAFSRLRGKSDGLRKHSSSHKNLQLEKNNSDSDLNRYDCFSQPVSIRRSESSHSSGFQFASKTITPAAVVDSQSHCLMESLSHFGVDGVVVGKHAGPVSTRFEVELGPGIKSSIVANLHKDIARSLRVQDVRVIEVINGKSCIGIEIPNRQREIFSYEDLSDELTEADGLGLPLLLGSKATGEVEVADLHEMPHLLIAGATKSGKTMLLQSMLLSLTTCMDDSQLNIILIDPKCIAFSAWQGVPHLMGDIVIDADGAIGALNWCVEEMERRYQAMHNGASYFPKIVVVVDEFADLMMTHKNEVESAVCRLAQKARQSDIHLILATQRPTADVITGHIKANITNRIALSVSEKRESRIVLDESGAETLLGKGDMIFKSSDRVCERVHAPYVSDELVRAHVARLIEAPCHVVGYESYNSEPVDFGSTVTNVDFQAHRKKVDDEFFDAAVAFVKEAGRASTSALQRHFSIGYNRAACIMDQMEARGVIGKKLRSNGPREVLVS